MEMDVTAGGDNSMEERRALNIHTDVYDDWWNVGMLEGLTTDTHIARFLLKRYRDSQDTQETTFHCTFCKHINKVHVKRASSDKKSHAADDGLLLTSGIGGYDDIFVDVINTEENSAGNRMLPGGFEENKQNQQECVDNRKNHPLDAAGLTYGMKKAKSECSAEQVGPNNLESHKSAQFQAEEVGVEMEHVNNVYRLAFEKDGDASAVLPSDLVSDKRDSAQDKLNMKKKAEYGAQNESAVGCEQNEDSANKKFRLKKNKKKQPSLKAVVPSDGSLFKCASCESVFVTQTTLKMHVLNDHPNIDLTKSASPDKVNVHFDEGVFAAVLQSHALNEILQNQAHVKTDENVTGNVLQSQASDDSNKQFLEEAQDSENPHKKTQTNSEKEKSMGDKPYACSECDKSFRTRKRLREHKNRHVSVSCSHCGEHFNFMKTFQNHMMKIHGESLPTCGQCGRCFQTSELLKKHEKCHPTSYSCNDCSGAFSTSRKLKKHQKDFHADMICPMCQVPCKGSKNLDIHMQTHTEAKPYVCTECGRSYETRPQLTNHKRRHRDSHPCDYCDGVFNCKSLLKKHQKDTHAELLRKEHRCSICQVTFCGSRNLKEHMRIHTGEKPFVCSDCGLTFRTATFLHRHMHKHAGTIKSHVCSVCRVSFRERCDLRDHFRIHTGEKPFVCSYCGLTFRTASTLKIHVRKHTGEKPYICPYCGMAFRRATYLAEHKRTHTGEKPFVCDVCGVGFAQKGMLNSHKKTHAKRGDEGCVSTYISMYVNTESHSQNSA